jgi:hypothetical protein
MVLIMGKATQDLKKEHDSILHVLKITDKVMSANRDYFYNSLHYPHDSHQLVNMSYRPKYMDMIVKLGGE